MHRTSSGNNAQMSDWVPIRIQNGICQQAALCCLEVQKSPHSRKLEVQEETKGSVRSDICYPHRAQCSQFDQ